MGEGAVLGRGLPGMRPRLLLLGKDARAPLLTSLAYLIGAEAAFLVGTLSDTIFAPFWPPNVVLFCALLLTPAHRWWIYLAAAAPAHGIRPDDPEHICCADAAAMGFPCPRL